MASPLGFRRRRLLATDTALLASSLDFLQGTFEKIQLHRLVNQHPLQLVDFLTERGLARAPWWRHLAGVEGIKLISPLVQKPPMHTKFLRQFHDVVAGLQSLDCHPPEFFRVSSHSSFCHLQFLSLQVCLIRVSQVKGSVQDTPARYRFVQSMGSSLRVESWAEHLRQHGRLTSADRELEENVRRFESKPIKVRHFIYARSKRGRH